jgi:hypothetical protein
MMYRQVSERAALSIERETDSVPWDGYYYVIQDGAMVTRCRSLKAAQAKYKDILDSLDLPAVTIGESERKKAAARGAAGAALDQIERDTFAASNRRRAKTSRTRTYG